MERNISAIVSNASAGHNLGGAWCALEACWAPPATLIPRQVRLRGSGVPHDSPLEGHSLWDFALTTAWLSQEFSILFYFSRKPVSGD